MESQSGTVSLEQTWPDGRLILFDRSTSAVTLTVVDALPLAELEGLLELRHVFNVDRVPVSGEIIHLDENVSLRS